VAAEDIIVRLRALGTARFRRDTDDAARGVERVGREASHAETRSRQASAGFLGLHQRMRVLRGTSISAGAGFKVGLGGALAAAGGITALSGAVRLAASEYQESAKVTAQTNAVLKSTGGAANISARGVSRLSTALSNKTAIDDETIQSGANMLLTFKNVRNETGRGNKIFSQATGVLTDMSVALGVQPRRAAIQLGKALNDPVKGVSALTRVGVTFNAQQKAQIATLVASGKRVEAQRIILRELNSEFGGSAAAAATPIDHLKTNFRNLAESLGGLAAPVVNKGIGLVATFLGQLQSGQGAGGAVVGVLRSVGSTIGQIVSAVGPTIMNLGRQLMSALAPMAPFLRNVVIPLVKGLAIGIGATLVGAITVAIPIIRIIANVLGFIGRKAAPLRGIIQGIGLVIGFTFGPGIIGGILKASGYVGRFAGAITGLAGRARSAAAAVVRTLSSIPGRLGGLVGRMASLGVRLAGAIARGISSAFGRGVGLVANIGRQLANWLNANTPLGDEIHAGPLHFRLPGLAGGGFMPSGGSAVVGERGPELVSLGRPASVIPLDQAASPAAGHGTIEVVVQHQTVLDGGVLYRSVSRHAARGTARR
jgi:hypothetical protein